MGRFAPPMHIGDWRIIGGTISIAIGGKRYNLHRIVGTPT